MSQRGVALIAGLALLAALSLLALVATSGMILQQHMASNYHENKRALENSAIAASYASAWLFSRENHERETDCISGCLLPEGIHSAGELPRRVEYQGPGWWQSNGFEAGVSPGAPETEAGNSESGAVSPLWVLEELHFEASEIKGNDNTTEGIGYYRILSRGTGMQAKKIAITESIVARPWGGDYKLDGFPPGPEASEFCLHFAGETGTELDCGRLAWRQRR